MQSISPLRRQLTLEPLEDRLVLDYDFSNVRNMIRGALLGQGVQRPIRGAAVQVLQLGQVLYEEAFGDKTLDSVVLTASACKDVSAATIMTLYDEGLLTLDSRPAELYPEFDAPLKDRITLRQLMSHTSGLPQTDNYIDTDRLTLQQAVQSIGAYDRVQYPPPGAYFAYGGVALHVAGGMAELASGAPWEQLFQTRIAQPLGMEVMTYGPTPNPRIAGGARTNLHDFAAFMQMMVDYGSYNGQQVLSPEAVWLMTHDQRAGAVELRSPNPGVAYGLGTWLDIQDENGDPVQIGAYGAFGFSAWADYTRNLVGVFLVQDSYANVRNLINRIQAEVRAQVPPWTRPGGGPASGGAELIAALPPASPPVPSFVTATARMSSPVVLATAEQPAPAADRLGEDEPSDLLARGRSSRPASRDGRVFLAGAAVHEFVWQGLQVGS